MRKHWIVMAAVAGLMLSACQRQAENLVEVTGHLFVFNYRVASATYLLTLKKTGPIPDGSVIIAEFENPEGGDPLVLNQKIYPIDDKIALQSEKLHCVRKGPPLFRECPAGRQGRQGVAGIEDAVPVRPRPDRPAEQAARARRAL